MPKVSKKEEKKIENVKKEETKEKEEAEDEPKIKKTSIMISTKVRDRLWRLKFRMTYDEFLWELCEMYEKSVDND